MNKQLYLPGLEKFKNEVWFGLSLYAPWSDLWLQGIKQYETRPKGTSQTLPIVLLIHTTKNKMCSTRQQIAQKYLGEDYEPQYSKVIGICTLNRTISMNNRLIEKQSPKELELGNWSTSRVAWEASNRVALSNPVTTIGYQAAPWQVSNSLQQLIIAMNTEIANYKSQ